MSITGANLTKIHATFQPILDKYDQARRLLRNQKGINMMSVVVIGDQSHGKSSLLESISGIDLPRGSGTKTRVPLEIQLRNAKSKQEEEIKIGAKGSGVDDIKEEVITESEISEKIDSITNTLAGDAKEKRIVNKPITLNIKKQGMVDLTLIDLPGIIHNDPSNPNSKMPQV